MKQLQIGFATVNANPMLGISVSGYFIDRFAKGFLDDIQVSAMAQFTIEIKVRVIALK